MFRGNTANAFKNTLAEIMLNTEWKNLVTVLRCGIGNSFDINKLYFDRINLFTDQDIDGFFISSGMLAFFYKFLPEIIKQGKLYKVYTPLYSLEDKEHPFVSSKSEMIDVYHKKIVKNYKIKFIDYSDNYATKDDLRDFLEDSYDYRENLIRISKDMGKVNKILIEAIIAYMTMCGVVRSGDDYDNIEATFDKPKFISFLMSHIQERFPEITLKENQNLSGIADGRFALIKVNSRFIRKASDLIPLYTTYGYKLEVEEKGRPAKIMTIGEFLDDCQKYMPKIKTRYKGLGELDGSDLYDAALDINTRVSIQYTMESAAHELEILNVVHGPEKSNVEKRKEMMKRYKIKRDDLDN